MGTALRRLMRGLAHAMPAAPSGERPQVARLLRAARTVRDVGTGGPLRRRVRQIGGRSSWPIVAGTYIVGDRSAPIAVCTLTSAELLQPLAALPHVSIAGQLCTVNLGIENIIINVTANPSIRFFLLCGRDSPVFQPAQGLRALLRAGVTPERRIVGRSDICRC